MIDAPTTGAPAERQADYENEAKVRLLVERCIDEARRNEPRRDRDLSDLYNLLFYRGGEENHWAILNRKTGQVEPRPYDGPAGLPPWVPRCTTNKLANKIDGIVALMNQSIPAKTFGPKTDDDEDLATADVCEDADPVLLDEIGYEALKRRAHLLIALTDKIAFVYYFDNDARHGMHPIEMLQCLECQELMTPLETGGTPVDEMEEADEDAAPEMRCPHCGSEAIVPAVDGRGQPIGMDYPIGKICADIWTSYEFSLPSSARVPDADHVPWVLGHPEMSIERVCRDWPDHAEKIRRSSTPTRETTPLTKQYAAVMAALSSPRSANGFGRANEQGRGMVTVYRLQHDPITDEDFHFPEGLNAVLVGDVLVDAGPLPFKDQRGNPRKNIILRTFRDTPQSAFGKPPCDDLVPVQKSRNQNESLLKLILMMHAAPTTYLPDGVTLIDELTGVPGQIVRYRSLNPGDRPFTDRGVNPPEGLFRAIEMDDEAMEELSGLNSVLQGSRPDGDPTLGEVQILQERGMQAFRTPLDHLIDFERRQTLLLLDIARQTAWAPRFRRVMGENRQWEISQFTAADLSGQVDVVIEPLSAWPKSPSMQLVKLQKAIEMGVLNPAMDPEVAAKVLTLLGLSELKPSLDADRLQISRELDRWKAAVSPAEIEMPNLAAIEPAIHLAFKKNFLKTEGAEAIQRDNAPVYRAIVQHIQQLQFAMMPAPTDAGPDGSAVQGAVDAGVLTPAGAEPPAPPAPNPMQAAVDAGVLMPQGAVDAGQPTGPSIDQLMEAGAIYPAPQAPPSA